MFARVNSDGNAGEPQSLPQLLDRQSIIVAPGAWDPLTAYLVQQAGFPAVYMSGAATSLAKGYPDLGLLTQVEMAQNAGAMAASVSVPVIADADTGFGNALNMTRTVFEYERRGVAAIHIEDQVMPKRCGHLDGKEIVSRSEFVGKIKAACAARKSPEFLIIARTDAHQVDGFDEAIDRANAALAAGADIAFVEAMETREELALVPQRVRGPCLYNAVIGGKSPHLSVSEAEAMGYRIAIVPGIAMRAAVAAIDQALSAYAIDGMLPNAKPGAVQQSFDRFGSSHWQAIGERFGS